MHPTLVTVWVSRAAGRTGRSSTFRATRSYIAARVSAVALAMCGTSTTFSSASSPGWIFGSSSYTSSPAPLMIPSRSAHASAVLVHDRPARRVDEVRRPLHPRQRRAIDQVLASAATAARAAIRRPRSRAADRTSCSRSRPPRAPRDCDRRCASRNGGPSPQRPARCGRGR